MSSAQGSGPLAGRSILLTRSGGSPELADRLRRLGATVDARPTVALVGPQDPSRRDAAITAIAGFDWILFTSANGARFFHDALRSAGLPSPPARVAAIGGATAAALSRRGITASLVARESDSAGFAAALADRISRGQRVLVVRPEVARDVLPRALRARGAEVDTVAFYRNVPAPGVPAIARDVGGGRYDIVVFHSPSALAHLLAVEDEGERTRAGLRNAARVAIGRVTAAALDAAGLGATSIASRSSDDGVVEAIRSL